MVYSLFVVISNITAHNSTRLLLLVCIITLCAFILLRFFFLTYDKTDIVCILSMWMCVKFVFVYRWVFIIPCWRLFVFKSFIFQCAKFDPGFYCVLLYTLQAQCFCDIFVLNLYTSKFAGTDIWGSLSICRTVNLFIFCHSFPSSFIKVIRMYSPMCYMQARLMRLCFLCIVWSLYSPCQPAEAVSDGREAHLLKCQLSFWYTLNQLFSFHLGT